MASERKNGAGSRFSGVLERASAPPERPSPAVEADEPENAPPVETAETDQGEPTPQRSRGAASTRSKSRTLAARAAKRVKGRTIYMPDDLFERLLVQSHRRDLTISDYVVSILDRSVPDHRQVIRAESDQDAA